MQALPDANAELRSIRGRQRFGSKKKNDFRRLALTSGEVAIRGSSWTSANRLRPQKVGLPPVPVASPAQGTFQCTETSATPLWLTEAIFSTRENS